MELSAKPAHAGHGRIAGSPHTFTHPLFAFKSTIISPTEVETYLPPTHSPGQPVGDVHVEQSGGSRLSRVDAAANDASKKMAVTKPVAERIVRVLTKDLQFEYWEESNYT